MQAPADAPSGTLVSIAQFVRDARGPPLAVGRMAVDSDKIDHGVTKGKAVIVLHTWKDYLWTIGSKCEPPEAVLVSPPGGEDTGAGGDDKDAGVGGAGEGAGVNKEPVIGDQPVEGTDGPISGPEEKLTPEGNVSCPSYFLAESSKTLLMMLRPHQRYPPVYEQRSYKLYKRLSLTSRRPLSQCPQRLYTQCTFFPHELSRVQLPHPWTLNIPRSSRFPLSYVPQKRAVC